MENLKGRKAQVEENPMRKNSNFGMRSLVILSLAVITMLSTGSVLAQGPGGGQGGRYAGRGPGFGDGARGPEYRLEVLAERLELTEEQIVAIKGIREAGQEKNQVLRKELIRLNHDLKGELLKDDPSEKTALDLVKKIGALETEMDAGRLENRLEVRKQLTPEQRDKMLMMKERFNGGRGHRGGGVMSGHHGRGDCGGPCNGRGLRGGRGNL